MKLASNSLVLDILSFWLALAVSDPFPLSYYGKQYRYNPVRFYRCPFSPCTDFFVIRVAALLFLAGLYKSTGRAIAVTTASVSALQNVSFWLKFLKAYISWTSGWIWLFFCLMLATGLKFYAVSFWYTSVILKSRSQTLKFYIKVFG